MKPALKEWLRTALLLVIIIFGITYIIWNRHAADTALLPGFLR